jgi:hypothetical protein
MRFGWRGGRKRQTPSSKLQRNINHQIPNQLPRPRTGVSNWSLKFGVFLEIGAWCLVVCLVCGIISATVHAETEAVSTNVVAWCTNTAAVYAILRSPPRQSGAAVGPFSTNAAPAARPTALTPAPTFAFYLPRSLNNLIWTNFISHTNGRTTVLWSVRSHPLGWPANPPVVVWNTNCLAYGMTGLTAISPCWQVEGYSGQVPVTALTRRHGYARGHGMGPDGFNTNFAGKKVWFLATNNTLVEATVARDVVRTTGQSHRDYTILLFDKDLPPSIQPMRVTDFSDMAAKYALRIDAPRPIFQTEQSGNISTGIPGFTVNTWKGGDSGSPDMLPMPGELVFYGGRSTSGPSAEMQADMDRLCAMEGLESNRYHLRWLDLSSFPTYR